MSFHEIRFPTAIALKSTGGPQRRTEIVTLGSGFEERNAVWAGSRRSYNAGYGVKSLNDLHAVIAFFEARRGRLHGFRWKDGADFKSCAPLSAITPLDQALGTGDGRTKSFLLTKTYTSGPASWTRVIAKPVAGTVRVAVAGHETAVAVDTATGLVTFATPPASGVPITAGFAFDTPVRFDTDVLAINLESFIAGDIPAIPLVEIRV
jgi:uncharacterized protein (TIGR02217 family)